jgi:phospholipid transport system substrate-binding protein
MREILRIHVGLAAAWGFLLFALPLWAAGPMEEIRTSTDQILAILSDSELEAPSKKQERLQRLREVVNGRFDWEAISRGALSQQWRELNDAQREEFTALFSKLVERTYVDRLEDHSVTELNEIRYVGEEVEGDRGRVRVEVVTDTKQEIPVEYRVRRKKSGWLVYDILIEGVSLVKNYRVQFDEILMKSSYQELLVRLRAKVDEE